ncbi:MAG: tetratricopeptide repeat protein [Planctomycetes bacterium]|nr:tetratricopeptide repeat protein [Planctomycetota bacterium]
MIPAGLVRLTQAGVLLAATSCAARIPPIPVQPFVAGELDVVRAFFDEQLRTGDTRSSALFLNGLAQVELLQGDLDRARRHFRQAGMIMGNWSTSSSEVLGVVLGAESSKTWKGDPYEKVMNAFYNGLLYWWAGEEDNARACFKKGILADAESDEGGEQTDCALLFWLAGRMSADMGLADQAESYFEEARTARQFAVAHGARGRSNNHVLQEPLAGNLVCLLGLGLGPRKVATGPHGSLAGIQPCEGGPEFAELFLGGRSLGRSALLADVDYQAMTRAGRAIEGIRKGKAVFKDVAEIAGVLMIDRALDDSGAGRRDKLLVGAGLLALSFLTRAEADVRCWATLPSSVHGLLADVPPGEHELQVRFFDAFGRELPGLDQVWTVDVPEQGTGVYYFHSLPAPIEGGDRSQ